MAEGEGREVRGIAKVADDAREPDGHAELQGGAQAARRTQDL
jgi:hypothetical protein